MILYGSPGRRDDLEVVHPAAQTSDAAVSAAVMLSVISPSSVRAIPPLAVVSSNSVSAELNFRPGMEPAL